MSNPYADFETDTDLERNGVWMDFGAYRIKIAASGSENPEFMTCYAEKLKPIRHALATKKLDEEVERKMLIEAYAETVVKDWENVTDRSGAAMEFSVENVIKLFTDLPRLFALVRNHAQNLVNFKVEEAQELGNG